MAATFKITPLENSFYQFHLLDKQGQMLLMSAEYEDCKQAEEAIKEVRVGSLMSQQIAKGKTPDGGLFFVIKNNSGDVIAKSMLFDNEMQFDNALHNVKDNACIAEISSPANS